jgi:hypothetical protein
MCKVLALTGLASCTSTAPPPPAPASVPAPAPRQPAAVALKPPLDTFAFYVGTWQCKGTSFKTSEQPEEEKWEATVEVAPELDGTWLSVKMVGPGMNRTAEHKGYDPTTKQWKHISVWGEGGWGVLSSSGWSGSQMVFTPDDKTDKTHATFTKLGETSYSHSVSADTEKGAEKVWEKLCTKM